MKLFDVKELKKDVYENSLQTLLKNSVPLDISYFKDCLKNSPTFLHLQYPQKKSWVNLFLSLFRTKFHYEIWIFKFNMLANQIQVDVILYFFFTNAFQKHINLSFFFVCLITQI